MKADFLKAIDDFILDRLFQPLVDRLPEETSAWNIGISFELGSVLLQVVCLLAPLLLYGATLGESVEAILVLLCSIMLFIGFQRFQTLVRPNMMNPLRPMMYSLRVVCLGFLLYETISLFVGAAKPQMWLWDRLGLLSQLTFVVGLYFMACQMPPPGARQARKRRTVIKGVVSDGVQ
ncbi:MULTISPECIES: hypothetical protein [Bombella]|uniref:Uncharacterized protein n=2 Tax=Bombella TaxID=1654741 RepID=A0ABT3WLT0_9PROT|nr:MULTISPECIES: hypothetical protein [Bombella]MCT6854935.1 hypothetical protein [Bombella apis]PHI96505.1 hypothetical protein BG621_05765 [Parasaccharibacter apium]MCX5614837.1 hypothetical protein [Bombella saccharophila]MCX5620079.1 hypothetical protein [Bombella pollinis]MUG05269.1 hypothetical protein [Bombella sp. ESL0378]